MVYVYLCCPYIHWLNLLLHLSQMYMYNASKKVYVSIIYDECRVHLFSVLVLVKA